MAIQALSYFDQTKIQFVVELPKDQGRAFISLSMTAWEWMKAGNTLAQLMKATAVVAAAEKYGQVTGYKACAGPALTITEDSYTKINRQHFLRISKGLHIGYYVLTAKPPKQAIEEPSPEPD